MLTRDDAKLRARQPANQQPDDIFADLMPQGEFADKFGHTEQTTRLWVRRGKAPPSVVIGRRRYFFRSKIPAWLELLKRGAA